LCDATLPLDELWMDDARLHMEDLRDPNELGLLGGVATVHWLIIIPSADPFNSQIICNIAKFPH